MAMMRTLSSLSMSAQAPPPSPIPTGKGSRSAADPTFSDHLEKSLKIPELSLPEHVHLSVPAEIHLDDLVSRERGSMKRLLRSAAEFGVFRISGHGVSTAELRRTLVDAGEIFQISGDGESANLRGNEGCKEILWRRFEEALGGRAREIIGAGKCWRFSLEMKKVTKTLEAIAEEVAKVISERVNKEATHKAAQTRESILSLHKYDKNSFMDEPGEEHFEPCCEHALSLHLLLEPCEFRVHSERGTLSFEAVPDTLVVIIAKQLEEWSLGELKSAHGEVVFEPRLSSTKAPFSMELKCWPSNFCHGPAQSRRTISVSDQILAVIIITLIYKMFLYICS